MAKAFSVFVEIGGRVGSSLGGAIATAEGKLAGLSRSMRLQARTGVAAMGELKTAMKSMGAFAVAGGISVGIKHALGAGAEFAHEIQALRNAGRTYEEVAEGIAAANKTILAVPTTTLSENMKILNETTGAFGDYHHALENLGFNAKLGSVLHNAIGEKAGDSGEMFNNLVRAMEIRGSANDPHRYQRETSELAKAMIFTRGSVNPAEFLNFAKMANPAIKNYSERFLTKVAPSLIQELGGDRAGTAATAWTNTIMGKAKDKRSTEAWMDLGLLDKKKVLKSKQGNYVGWQPGAIKGTDEALQDPLAWTENYLIPALEKHGVDTNDQLATTKALAKLYRNSNAQRFAQSITQVKDRQRLHKDEGLINKVGNFGDIYDETLVNDPKMALTALKASFENLFASNMVGLMKPASQAMVAVARGVNALSNALVKHPELATLIGSLGTALGAYSSLRLMSWALGLGGLGRAIASLAIGVPAGLIARLFGLVRCLFSLSAAIAFGGLARLRGMVAGLMMLSRVGAVSGVVRSLVGVLGLLSRAFVSAGVAMMTTPVGWVVAAVAAIAAIAYLCWKNWDKVGPFFRGMWEGVKQIFHGAYETIAGILTGDFGRAWEGLKTVFSGLGEYFTNGWSLLGNIFKFGIQEIDKLLGTDMWGTVASWLDTGTKFANDFIDGVKQKFEELKVWFQGLPDRVKEWIGSLDLTGWIKWPSMPSWFGGGGGGGSPKATGTSPVSTGFGGSGLAGAFAKGGMMRSGGTYLVGEKGPELVTPSRSGFVHTAAATSKMLNRFSEIGGSADGGSGRLRVPAAGDIAHATGGDRNVSVSRGDTSFSISINAPSGDGQEIATKVRAEVMRVIGQMESEQRGMLND